MKRIWSWIRRWFVRTPSDWDQIQRRLAERKPIEYTEEERRELKW